MLGGSDPKIMEMSGIRALHANRVAGLTREALLICWKRFPCSPPSWQELKAFRQPKSRLRASMEKNPDNLMALAAFISFRSKDCGFPVALPKIAPQ